MNVKLSKRLQQIAEQVPANSRIADIGSDHALLPTYLVQSGRIRSAIAGEVNPGPLEAALRQVKEAGLSDRIQVREGNGLAVLQAGEVDVITIAGMGGALIVQILNEGMEKLGGVQVLVLQPNVGEELVRKWLFEHKWLLDSEAIMEEDGKIYEIIKAIRADDADLHNRNLFKERDLGNGIIADLYLLMKMGPYLLDEASEIWFRKWEGELGKLAMIREQLSHSTAEAAKAKSDVIFKEMQQIKEVLACLQKVKR